MDKDTLNLFVNNNYDKTGIDNLTKFFGYNQAIYLDSSVNGYSFTFITKPSLFLYPQKPTVSDAYMNLAYENMCKDPEFTMFINGENTNEKDNIIVKQLSYFNFDDVGSLFMPIFTNLIKDMQTSDVILDTMQSFQTREGYAINMPTNTTQSEAEGTLSFSISDTANLDILKIMKIWVNYIKNVANGTFNANPAMIEQNMLDYVCSIYYFMVAPDGKTLRYWCRYTAAMPTVIPYSALSSQRGVHDYSQYDLQFSYALKEEMNPRILEDFNMLSLKMVTPLFSADSAAYSEFVSDTNSDNSLGYSSFSDSELLSKDKLMSGKYSNIVKSDDRDPVIMYEKGQTSSTSSTSLNGKYIISFGKSSLINTTLSSVLQENSQEFNYDVLSDND